MVIGVTIINKGAKGQQTKAIWCTTLLRHKMLPNYSVHKRQNRNKVITYTNLRRASMSLKHTPWTRRLLVTATQCGGMSLVASWDVTASWKRGTLAAGLLWEPNHASFAFLTQSGTCAVSPQCTAFICRKEWNFSLLVWSNRHLTKNVLKQNLQSISLLCRLFSFHQLQLAYVCTLFIGNRQLRNHPVNSHENLQLFVMQVKLLCDNNTNFTPIFPLLTMVLPNKNARGS